MSKKCYGRMTLGQLVKDDCYLELHFGVRMMILSATFSTDMQMCI